MEQIGIRPINGFLNRTQKLASVRGQPLSSGGTMVSRLSHKDSIQLSPITSNLEFPTVGECYFHRAKRTL